MTDAPSLQCSSGADKLRQALVSIAGWRSVNIAAEYEHGLRDIIRSMVDCAQAALDATDVAQPASVEETLSLALAWGNAAGQATMNCNLREAKNEAWERLAEAVESLAQGAIPAIECWSIVEQLRAPEGAEVILLCDNPDFNGQPNNAIEICDDWTRWNVRRFAGETMLDCLRAALCARTEDAAVKAQERRDEGR